MKPKVKSSTQKQKKKKKKKKEMSEQAPLAARHTPDSSATTFGGENITGSCSLPDATIAKTGMNMYP
jgi:hypothetical protein